MKRFPLESQQAHNSSFIKKLPKTADIHCMPGHKRHWHTTYVQHIYCIIWQNECRKRSRMEEGFPDSQFSATEKRKVKFLHWKCD